jgi:hypothetical protein
MMVAFLFELFIAKMRRMNKIIAVLTVVLLQVSPFTSAQIPTDSLVAYYAFSTNANDESGNNNHASIISASLTEDRFGQSNNAYMFNGTDQFIEIPDSDNLSISNTDKLSISVWMRCDTLNFPASQSSGYVHWMGKGVTGQHEWTFRIYNFDSDRPNRTSCYAFNLAGGLGAGSYEEETIIKGEWMHFVAIYDYPENRIQLYKNGTLRDTDLFSDYSIIPGNGSAPFRVGTRDFNSYFKGAIDDIRIYKRILDTSEIMGLFNETPQGTSGLEPNDHINDLIAYPNPAEDIINISIGAWIYNGDYLIKIINSNGQVVCTKEVVDDKMSININELNGTGMYKIILTNREGKLIATSTILVEL